MPNHKLRGLWQITTEVLMIMAIVAVAAGISGVFLWQAYDIKQQADRGYVQALIQGVAYLDDGNFKAAFNAPVRVLRIGYGYYHVGPNGEVREEILQWKDVDIQCSGPSAQTQYVSTDLCINDVAPRGANLTYVHVKLGDVEKVFRWHFVEVRPDFAAAVAQQVAHQVAQQVAQQVAEQAVQQLAGQVEGLAVQVAQIQQQLAHTGPGVQTGTGWGGYTAQGGGSTTQTAQGGGSGVQNGGGGVSTGQQLTTYVGYLQAIVTDYASGQSRTEYSLRTDDGAKIPLDLSGAQIKLRDFFNNYVGTGRRVYVTGYWSGNVFKVVEIGDASSGGTGGGGGSGVTTTQGGGGGVAGSGGGSTTTTTITQPPQSNNGGLICTQNAAVETFDGGTARGGNSCAPGYQPNPGPISPTVTPPPLSSVAGGSGGSSSGGTTYTASGQALGSKTHVGTSAVQITATSSNPLASAAAVAQAAVQAANYAATTGQAPTNQGYSTQMTQGEALVTLMNPQNPIAQQYSMLNQIGPTSTVEVSIQPTSQVNKDNVVANAAVGSKNGDMAYMPEKIQVTPQPSSNSGSSGSSSSSSGSSSGSVSSTSSSSSSSSTGNSSGSGNSGSSSSSTNQFTGTAGSCTRTQCPT